MIKIGKYTAAIILVLIGVVLLIDFTMNTEYTGQIVRWWPAVFIMLGFEYLVMTTVYKSTDRKLGLAFGPLVLAVVLTAGVLGFTQASKHGILDIAEFGWNVIADEGTPYKQETKRIPLSGEKKLKLNNKYGELVMKEGDVSGVQVETTVYVPRMSKDGAEAIAAESKIEYEQHGDTLEITAEGKRYRVFLIRQRAKMNLVVTVPRGQIAEYELNFTNGSLDIEQITVDERLVAVTTNGSIKARDIHGEIDVKSTNGTVAVERVNGNVRLETTNGTLIVRNVQGSVDAETTNGQVEIKDINGHVEADSTNGKLVIYNVTGKIDAETTNGGITVEASSVGDAWSLENTNGGIVVRLPRDTAFNLEGKGRNIRSDFPANLSNKTVSGSVNGGGPLITIDTNSSIQLLHGSN